MGERFLRIAEVLVQPVLVWDDGDKLTPVAEGAVGTVKLGAHQVSEFIAGLPDRLDEVAAQLEKLETQGAAQS